MTRHTHLTDPVLSDRLWALYDASYQQVSTESPSHEMKYRDEFDDALRDPANRIWVLWDDAAPVAMTLIGTEIGSARYLSRGFFEQHYPEHSRRNSVHYIMWLVVHPVYAAQGAIVRMAREVLQREAADGALLVFDVPDVHQPGVTGGFAEMMERLAKAFVGDAPVRHIGSQYYFA
ncbi:MAG: GNAT family N-acetyltransferase, partial [Actinomycetota bacterium]